MKCWDTCKLAFKGLRRGWAAIIVLGIMMSVVCFSFAGAIQLSMKSEKAKPCELTIQASDTAKLTDQSVSDILQIPNVMAATGMMEVPVTLKSGKYTATLTLCGIDRGYLKDGFSFGGLFPETSVMPYIVLNGAAVKQFVDKENPPAPDQTDYAPAINWVSAGIALSFGEDASKPITSKVCGILESKGEEEEETPAGYTSISVAKELLRNQNMPAEYTSIAVRLQSIGLAKDVAKRISDLGYTASDPSVELQAVWERREMEMTNLIMVGAIGLLYFSFLIAAVDRGNLFEEHRQLDTMRWIGMTTSNLKVIYFLRTAIADTVGVFLGITISYIIPSFVPEEQTATSIFALQVPALVTVVVGVASIGLFLLPSFYADRKMEKGL